MKTLKTKITAIYILLVILVAIIGVVSCVNVYKLAKSIDGLMTDNYKSIVAANNMAHVIEVQDKAILQYTADQQKKTIDTFYNENDVFYKWFYVEKNNITELGEKGNVENISTDYLAFVKEFSELQVYKNNHSYSETIDFYNSNVLLKVNKLETELKNISSINEKAMFNGKNRVKTNAEMALYLILAISAAAAAGGLIVSTVSTNKTLKPIYLLTETIRSVKEGELYKQAPVFYEDEIGMLSCEFNNMTKRLHEFEQSTTGKLLAEKNKSIAIVKSILDPLIVLDESYKIILLNKSCETLFEIQEENVISKHILEAIRNVELYDYIFYTINNGTAEHEKIIKFDSAEENYYFSIIVTAVTNEENKVKSIVVLLKNITEFKKLEKVRSDFIATVSHEFKTPLTSIMMGVGLMLEKNLGALNEKQKSVLVTIKDEVEKLTDLVVNLLKLSRIQSDRAIFDIKPCYLLGIVDKCIKNYCKQAEGKEINLYDETDETLPRICADEEKITWVLNNLVSNALKYTNAGDEIIIGAYIEDENMNIYVKDTGVGIPEEYRKNIFNKFVKVRGYDRELISTGLGLSIAKEIVEAHGGTIWCESKLDEGSTFTFTLPIVKEKLGVEK